MFSEHAEEPGHFKDELEIAKQLNHPCPDPMVFQFLAMSCNGIILSPVASLHVHQVRCKIV